MKIKIKYFSDKIDKLKFIDGKSDWIDLRSAERVELKKGDYRLIIQGVGMQMPKGYEALVVPRSTTYKNYLKIQTNSNGVVDESYSGNNDEWKFPVLAMRDTLIEVNDRICQFRIIRHQDSFTFEEVEALKEVDRGGFGSTGKN